MPHRVLVADWDITTDIRHYVNIETALYFDVKTIVAGKWLLSQTDPEFHY
ncbi:MAG: hypothetical protein H7Z21_06550 [Hymenobacter sp.]|nr:hypothetical protein [Hymenobacter sp.]